MNYRLVGVIQKYKANTRLVSLSKLEIKGVSVAQHFILCFTVLHVKYYSRKSSDFHLSCTDVNVNKCQFVFKTAQIYFLFPFSGRRISIATH